VANRKKAFQPGAKLVLRFRRTREIPRFIVEGPGLAKRAGTKKIRSGHVEAKVIHHPSLPGVMFVALETGTSKKVIVGISVSELSAYRGSKLGMNQIAVRLAA